MSATVLMITEAMKKKGWDQEVLLANGKVSTVSTLNTTFIKPAKRMIGKTECPLITFDLPYLAFYYNQKLMLYQSSDDFNEIVGKMKDGLVRVLEDFYQLAGKLGKDEEGIFRIEYDEDDNMILALAWRYWKLWQLILEFMMFWLRRELVGS